MPNTPAKSLVPSSGAAQFVAAVRHQLETQYRRPFSLTQLAASAGVSPGHLVHAFAKSCGNPPISYLIEVRVRRAREFLEAGIPVKQVAALTGFYDQAHLGRHFKRLVGEPPARYAARRRKGRPRLER